MRRQATHAGSWYAAEPAQLRAQFAEWFAGTRASGEARYIVAPHAGYTYCGPTAAHAFAFLPKDAKRVFVLGPSHRGVAGAAVLNVSPFAAVETPLGDLAVDAAGVAALTADARVARLLAPREDLAEHSVEMMMPFIAFRTRARARVVPVVVRGAAAPALEAAAAHLRAAMGDGDFLVVSSDFCHFGERFGYAPDLGARVAADGIERLDRGGVAAMGGGARAFREYLERTQNTICGRVPIELALRVFPPAAAAPTLLHYAQSERLTSRHGSSVSYAAVAGMSKPAL